jgi:hypothetical protein
VNEHLQQVSVITGTTVFTIDPEESAEQSPTEHSLENLQPVSMTDEVLKDYGFVFHDYFKFWQLLTTGIRSEMDIDRDYDVIDFMRKPIVKKLASLHQLQNIYFMMKGRELKFNKKAMPVA